MFRYATWKSMFLCWGSGVALLALMSTGVQRATAQGSPNLLWMHGQHRSQINSVAITPDGALIATGSGDKTIKLWRTSDGTLLHTLYKRDTNNNLANDAILAVAISSDGRYLVSSSDSYDTALKVWSLPQGNLLFELQKSHTQDVTSLAFSPNGKYLASASNDKTVKIWGVTTSGVWPLKKTLDQNAGGHSKAVATVAFSADSTLLASGGYDNAIKIWNVADWTLKKNLNTQHTSPVDAVSFSTDGKYMASGSNYSEEVVKLWKTADWSVAASIKVGHVVNALKFSPDSRTLALAAASHTPFLYGVPGLTLKDTFNGHTGNVNDVAFTRDGLNLVSASVDNTGIVWDVSSGSQTAELTGPFGPVTGLAASPDGKYLATGGSYPDERLMLWDAKSGLLVKELDFSHNILALAFTHDSSQVAVAGPKSISIYTIPDLALVTTLNGHTANVEALAFSPDGKTLASGSDDKTINVWNVTGGTLLGTLPSNSDAGHKGNIRTVAFSPDGKKLASGSIDKTIKIWNMSNLRLERTLTGHTSDVNALAYLPNGKSLYSGSGYYDKSIRKWDTASWSYATLLGHTDVVNSLDTLKDSYTVLSGSTDKTLQFWNVADGGKLQRYDHDTGFGVNEALFLPGGARFAYACSDGTVAIATNPLPPIVITSFVFTPAKVQGGKSVTATLTINRAAPQGDVIMPLTSSNATVAAVPAQTVIKAGTTSIAVTVTTTKVKTSSTITLTATAGGVRVTQQLQVTP